MPPGPTGLVHGLVLLDEEEEEASGNIAKTGFDSFSLSLSLGFQTEGQPEENLRKSCQNRF